VQTLPGHEDEAQEYFCDRELVQIGTAWRVVPLDATSKTLSSQLS
jgi:hypothetical protein